MAASVPPLQSVVLMELPMELARSQLCAGIPGTGIIWFPQHCGADVNTS